MATADTKTTKTEKKSMQDLYATDGKPAVASKEAKVSGRAYAVLVKPMITEKASILSTVSKYIFMVTLPSNKIDVAKAIHEVYGVKPISVNIIRSEGKIKRYGKYTGKRKDFKKAIVTLAKGQTIQVYEGV
jgi:large subunit ribosomal protein L23